MAADNVTSIERAEDRVAQRYADWTSIYQASMAAYIASGQAMITGTQSLNAELLAFMQSRMKSGLEAGKRLGACSSPESVAEIQIEYGRSALQAYADESRRIGELLGKLMTDTIEPLRTQATAAAAKARDSIAA